MKNISTFLVVAILLNLTIADLTPEEKTKVEESNKTCLKSSGASPEQIAQIRSGKFTNDPKIQKYFGCMLRSVGVINAKGQLQIKMLKSKVPKDMNKDEAMKVYLSCKDKKGANVDETAYLLYKCFWESSPRHLGLDGQ